MLVNGAIVAGKGAGSVKTRSSEETEQIRVILRSRFDELNAEYEEAAAQNHRLRLVEIGDAAGDDQADSGSKTAERDAASSLLRTLLERRTQAEHALQRLDAGSYGNCEGCSHPIPVERLEVFPSATTCVNCKAVRERRAS
ncbi:DnaK suppressor protein [Actinoplanes lutulentus]|uniref:TraR/DksA family transcriptional regulator n=1 Tax=Actinoplanes lutulentus TaxID=1287878 RepID=A0A327ZJ77_9ACTN|nr:TraR/DksA C4-type zinc finger protein [Actinoplanes lutulentus]MBB2944058.1 DnaK suppressor protein [Actinoplanes lutulentus]RAK42709.1 TraR/DksA family transcriptional regulator [Actinoplanes lutulentus]